MTVGISMEQIGTLKFITIFCLDLQKLISPKPNTSAGKYLYISNQSKVLYHLKTEVAPFMDKYCIFSLELYGPNFQLKKITVFRSGLSAQMV